MPLIRGRIVAKCSGWPGRSRRESGGERAIAYPGEIGDWRISGCMAIEGSFKSQHDTYFFFKYAFIHLDFCPKDQGHFGW